MSSLNILHTEVYLTRTNPWLITCVSVIATCFLLALTRVTSYLVDLHNQESGPHGCRRLGLHAKSNLEDEHHERYSRPEQKGGIAAWKVKSLWIYPVKSCKGVELNEGTVTGRGMEYDRQFCFAQLVSKFPASQDESREEKAKHAWKFITQRTFPAMANVKTELWIPDQSSLTYAEEHPHIKSEGVLVLRFPSLVKEIGFWRGVWDILKPFGRKRETTVHIPFNPTDEQVSKSGYPVENMEIWKDNPTSILMASTESSEPWIQDLRYYLGITNHLALFRARSDKPREVYRCAPRRAEIGYQSTVAFQDAYPLHILNLASVHDVARNMEKGAPSIGARNFRPNIVITGGDAYAEDSWKRISIGDFEYYAACRTVRCLLPNVNPATGVRHRSEPNRTLKAIRRIDEGDPKNACLGMQMVPAIEASRIAVGDAITVLETGEHFYIKQ